VILSGAFSGRRHRVDGKIPAKPSERFDKALRRHAFSPIDATSDRTRAVGWVNPRQILDSRVRWDKIVFGPHVVLGLRIDQRTVSRPILRARVAQAQAERRRERPGGKVSREERTEIAKVIEADLLRQTPPSTTVHELAWNTQTGRMWFSSTAQRANEEMTELFERTFDLTPVPLVPFTLADNWVDRHGRGGAALERATPADLRSRS
jgi:hypothetical protein